jgi:hypothetical protein
MLELMIVSDFSQVGRIMIEAAQRCYPKDAGRGKTCLPLPVE